MYIVRFVRADGKPDEEYFYHSEEDARYHASLFKGEDTQLYLSIQVVEDTQS